MFPTKLKCLKQEYLRRGQKINITRKIQNSIKKKAKKVLKGTHKCKNVTYTNLIAFINEITKGI